MKIFFIYRAAETLIGLWLRRTLVRLDQMAADKDHGSENISACKF